MKFTQEEIAKIENALRGAKGAFEALKTVGADRALPGFNRCLTQLNEAINLVGNRT